MNTSIILIVYFFNPASSFLIVFYLHFASFLLVFVVGVCCNNLREIYNVLCDTINNEDEHMLSHSSEILAKECLSICGKIAASPTNSNNSIVIAIYQFVMKTIT